MRAKKRTRRKEAASELTNEMTRAAKRHVGVIIELMRVQRLIRIEREATVLAIFSLKIIKAALPNKKSN